MRLPSSFQRVHRNAIVNVNHVRKMAALTSNRWLMTLFNDMEFVVSKRQVGIPAKPNAESGMIPNGIPG